MQVLNALAVTHHQLGKHQTAAIYLQSALEAAQARPACSCGSSSSQQRGDDGPSSNSSSNGKTGKGGKNAKGNKAGGKGKGGTKGVGQAAAAAAAAGGGGQQGTSSSSSTWPGEPPGSLAADHRHALLYNLGLQHLMLRNWAAALNCFEGAGQRYYMQPMLWVRLAEANVGLYHQHTQAAQQQQQPGQLPWQDKQQQQQQQQGMGQQQGQRKGQRQQHQQQQQQYDVAYQEQQLRGCLVQLLHQETWDVRQVLPLVVAASHAISGPAAVAGAAVAGGAQVSGELPAAGAGAAAAAAAAAAGIVKLEAAAAKCLDDALLQLNVALALLQDMQAEAAKEAEEAAALAAAAAAAVASGAGHEAVAAAAAKAGAAHSAMMNGHPVGLQHLHHQQQQQLQGAAGHGLQQPQNHQRQHGEVGGMQGGIRPIPDLLAAAEWAPVQQTILSNLAYVHLALQDPLPALHAAQALLACNNVSAEQHFLGSSYAAEALCMLGTSGEAAEQLHSHMALHLQHAEGAAAPGATHVVGAAAGGGAGPPGSTRSDDDAGIAENVAAVLGNAAALGKLSGSAAKACLLVNWGTVHAMQEEWGAAESCARKALALEHGNLAALLLLVYLRFRRGVQ